MLTTLHSFAGGPTDGGCPNAELIQATNGKFYGTTEYGGPGYEGTVFKITSAGVLTTLYGFYQDDGGWPSGGVVQDAGGNLYGTTFGGGLYLYGTVFKLTPSGTLTGLHNFCAQGWPDCADGFYPDGGLVQATDGNFYGTTLDGGANQDGTVFEITAGGTLITLYAFCTQANCTDGRYPHAGLLQATNGNLYGTTSNGGAKDSGTVFSLSMGLAPFVETLPTLGRVGSRIIILGTDLTGATGVSFNGTAATYTVASSTKIKTTVPPGATTGLVTVITPTGTLNSNSLFRVTPRILSFSPSSGPIGTPVVITGTSFTQVEKVAFGGVAATSFTVDSDTQVTAIVPVGALTGRIRIKTLGGARWSATEFTVTP